MSGGLKILSALNVVGWVVLMPILMVLLVSPFISFEGLPTSGILDRKASAQVAQIAPAPKPASAAATSGLAVAAAAAHSRTTSGVSLSVLSDSIETQGLAGRIPGGAPVMVASLRQIVSGGTAQMRRSSSARKTGPTAVAAQVTLPAISEPTLSLLAVDAPTAAVTVPLVEAPVTGAKPATRKAKPVHREKPAQSAQPVTAASNPATSSPAPAPSAQAEQHPGATNRSERAPEKREHPEQSQSQSRGNGRN